MYCMLTTLFCISSLVYFTNTTTTTLWSLVSPSALKQRGLTVHTLTYMRFTQAYWCMQKVWVCFDMCMLHTDILLCTKSVCVHVHACVWVQFDMHMLHTNILVCTVTSASLPLQTLLLGLNLRCDNTTYSSTESGAWCVMCRSLNCSGCVGCCLPIGLML